MNEVEYIKTFKVPKLVVARLKLIREERKNERIKQKKLILFFKKTKADIKIEIRNSKLKLKKDKENEDIKALIVKLVNELSTAQLGLKNATINEEKAKLRCWNFSGNPYKSNSIFMIERYFREAERLINHENEIENR
jgi:hypothetical protein